MRATGLGRRPLLAKDRQMGRAGLGRRRDAELLTQRGGQRVVGLEPPGRLA